MNRSLYYDYCVERLFTLSLRLETLAKSNILHLHLHSENFYVDFFNALYGYALKNMNAVTQNAAAIDLIDSAAKLVVQVSGTATKVKIESALKKDLSAYTGHQFKFILITKDAAELRGLTYANPHSLSFAPASDIHDVPSILRDILHLQIAQQKAVYELIKAELGSDADNVKEVSNLADVIGLLAQEDFSDEGQASNTTPFNVDAKIVFNNLGTATSVVEDYKIHQPKVTKTYAEYDKAGKNKSTSVLNALRSDYTRLRATYSDDDLFFQVVNAAMTRVRNSKNYVQMATEELEQCVSVLVVDAFIRCKIFKHPTVI
ncbi:hypothetical protein AWB69_07694 [Caballeronia udeis]|uniref:SMEK domain-containing protein n=1 Tax=Caballeronia udeis TaxID=1232866 RepID=A0A158JFX8_9BURK|nr:ABC-three component system protein [Caballeronia udeis]SAL67260.1 hypothetical protein AWB69_07694 [Caballeronia udeis]